MLKRLKQKTGFYGGILGSKIENVEALRFLTEARKKTKRSHDKNRSAWKNVKAR